MNYNEVLNLIDRIENSNFNTCEINFENTYINLSKLNSAVVANNTTVDNSNVATSVSTDFSVSKEEKVVDEKIQEDDCNDDLEGKFVIESPIVGTFYESSSVGKEAFVKVGDIIKEGDVLCIVEAMKVMNEVKSKFNGKIVKVLVENESMVEYNQPLFIIE